MLDTLHYILERRCPSGGYCFYRLDEPNAEDTYFALNALRLLCIENYDAKTVQFLKQLQYSDGGYQSLDMCFYCFRSLALMGYMGIKLCERLNIGPSYPSTVKDFVTLCKRKNGGYSRSETGIATLKYTYYALYILNALKYKFHNYEKSSFSNH